MRNLDMSKCLVLAPAAIVSGAQCFCLDCDRGTVWIVTGSDLCCIEDGKVSSVAPLSDHITSAQEDSIIGMEFVADLESVCLALSSGDVLLYNTSTCELDCVGSVEVGVVCMGWSPEQDVVVLVTKEDKLVLMTRDFDSITEVAMHPQDFGEAKPVTVGWGKKETQFHGSQGKPKAEQLAKKAIAAAPEGDDRRTRISWRGDGEYFVCSSIDPASGARQLRVWSRDCVLHSTSEDMDGLGQPLHWRPNGSLIGSTQQKPHRYDVVFFERNGLQHGEFPLVATPLGGGSHGDGAEGQDQVRVHEMMWSSDSSVLALWIIRKKKDLQQGGADGSQQETCVQLWTTGNYHWYLKQELRLPPAKDAAGHRGSTGLVEMIWDPIAPLTLHLLTKDGQYMCYHWRWSTAKSLSCSQLNSGSVAVIDGCKVLLTPFRHAVVPPPLSSFTVQLPSSINQVAFSPPPKCSDFLVLLASGEVAVFSYDDVTMMSSEGGNEMKSPQGFRVLLQPPKLVETAILPSAVGGWSQPHPLRQLVWWKPTHLLGIGHVEGVDSIVEFSLRVDRENNLVEIKQSHSLPLPGVALTLCTNPDTQTAVIQLTDGTVHQYTTTTDSPRPISSLSNLTTGLVASPLTVNGSPSQQPTLSPWLLPDSREMRFPDTCCEHVAMATFNNKEQISEWVVGLSESRRTLYVGDRKLITGCTSFAVHNEFLIFTTDTHTCRFLSLDSDPSDLAPLSSDKPLAHDENIRRVERGSRIVTVVPHDTRLVLQMPRGNLETISPRALVLSCIRRHLDGVEFKNAFILMRKHRINMNFIYDHNPKVFLDHCEDFVNQLDSVTDINLFLTELKNEDVTTTIYPGLQRQQQQCISEGVEGEGGDDESHYNKVDHVCVAVRRALTKLGANKYLLSIITTHVKMTHPELETVLGMIKQLKEQAPSDVTSDTLTAEDALKYTLFLVDVNQLYDVALGMYDFSLVLLVAEKSQKDPKEYLPFLNELRRLPLHYQRYRIDRHLRRFDKALQHISKCGPDKFPECLTLIKELSLYTNALSIYTSRTSDEYKTVAKAYGEYLVEKGKHNEAGIMFSQCGCLEEAMAAFEKAGHWRQVFTVTAQLNTAPPETMAIARRIANSLKSSRRYTEAARVLLDYAEDAEEAIVTLLEGSSWEEALRLIHFHRRTDLLETHLKPSLLEAHQSQVALFDSLSTTYLRHTARLAVVRETKRQKQNAILEGTYAADEKDADLFSDTSSITGRSAISSVNSSLLSKTSGRSTKNRRKAERKKHSLREGSANEDIALMEALGEIVTTVDRLQDEVASLLGMLVQFGFTSKGKDIQRAFDKLLSLVKSKMDEVWPPQGLEQPLSNLSMENIGAIPAGPGTTVNSIVAALAAAKTTTPSTIGSSVGPTNQPSVREGIHWKLDLLC